jgi:hypothetical protein
MPLDELRGLVYELLPQTASILDFDSGGAIKTDEEITDFLVGSYGLKHPADLQNYSRERRNDILRAAKEFGGSIRQLVRLTGISFGIIRKA